MPGTQITTSSGSERYPFHPERGRTSSSSASVHSPVSFESQSNTSSVDSWTDLGQPEYDGIEPSDSASRSRQPPSRRNTTEAPQPPSRHSATTHAAHEREQPRRRESHHRSRSHRHQRSESRRLPSDESVSTLATDDHPYHHGQQRQYAYRYVQASHPHGGYPPSVTSAGPYQDPFQQGQALVHMPQTDNFGYPTGNPFSPHAQPNPFSPMAAPPSTVPGYFPSEPAPMHHQPRPAPRSVYSNGSGYAPEAYHHPQQIAYAGYPAPMYPQMPFMYPSAHGASPAPDSATNKELEGLKELIRKHEEDRAALHKALIKRAEEDAAKKAKEEEEAKKKAEIAAASAKAKKDAEDAAADAAKKIKEDADKKLAEAQKATEAAETKKKELEEEIKKNKPNPDASKEPIKFKDAVHRKFSFPWSICKTWKGTESLIKQAFAHVDVLGQHVLDGHYDLLGPDGEIILPQVWETTVQPGWEVEMHMWPIAELEKPDKHHGPDPFSGFNMNELFAGLDHPAAAKASKKAGKSSKKDKNRKSQIVDVPMVPPSHQQDPFAAMGLFPGLHGMPGMPTVVPDKKAAKTGKSSSSKKKQQELPFMARWMGAQPAKKDDEKPVPAMAVRRKSTTSSDNKHQQQAQQEAACSLM